MANYNNYSIDDVAQGQKVLFKELQKRGLQIYLKILCHLENGLLEGG